MYVKNKIFSLLLISVVIIVVLILVEIGLMICATGSSPNRVYAPFIQHFSLFWVLLKADLWGSIQYYLGKEALLVVEHMDHVKDVQIWGLYFFPLSVIVHVSISVVVGVYLQAASKAQRIYSRYSGMVLIGVLLLILSVSYVQLVSCCTGGSGWVGKMFLLLQVFSPFSSSSWWEYLFFQLENNFMYVQFCIAMMGMIFIMLGFIGIRKRGNSGAATEL